jgi:ABC-type tungstate transport system permease subunit
MLAKARDRMAAMVSKGMTEEEPVAAKPFADLDAKWAGNEHRATWSNFKNRQNPEILTEGDPALFNLYSSILVNPARWPPGRTDLARTWHEWLTSKRGLEAIRSYRINGEQVFFPLDNAASR